MSIALHVDQHRDDSCIGASEAAGILGIDHWNPPIKVWRRHRGEPLPESPDNEPAFWGTVLEPVIRGKYALDRHVRVWVPTGSYTRDGWLRCTPDGIVEATIHPAMVGTEEFDPNEIDETGDGDAARVRHHITLGDMGGLQVKTCNQYLADDWRGGPPAKYEIQCRVELAVTGLPWCDIVCLIGGQKLVGPYRIERDLAIEERILEPLREFRDLVTSGVEPTVDHTEAWRLHVSEKMERAKPIVVAADPDMARDVTVWRTARATRKTAEEREALAENQILLRLSAAGATKIDLSPLGVKDSITAYKKKAWNLRAPRSWGDDE